MNRLKNALLTGIAAMLPIFLTGYVVIRMFRGIDSWLQPYIVIYFGQEILGLGFLLVLIIVIFVGLITNTYIARKITAAIDWVFTRIPFIKSIYTTMRGISSFSKPKEKSFRKVVQVEFPTKGIKSIGFITREDIFTDSEELVSVFIPTTPNPTNGFLVYVKPEELVVLDMTVEDGIKTVVSMGALTPSKLEKKESSK